MLGRTSRVIRRPAARAGRRSAWTVRRRRVEAGFLVLVGALLLSVGCEQFQRRGDDDIVRAARLAPGASLSIVRSELGAPVRRIVTSDPTVPVRVDIDPDLLQMVDVDRFVVWKRASMSSPWERVREIAPGAFPAKVEFGTGTTGLSASAILSAGGEILIPKPDDDPAVWLVVDGEPPTLLWVSPAPGAPVRRDRNGRVELEWRVTEAQIGEAGYRLEWRPDATSAWSPIDEVPPRAGRQVYRWRLPPGIPSEFEVRLSATDLAGHSSAVTVEMRMGPGTMVTARTIGPPVAQLGSGVATDGSAGLARTAGGPGGELSAGVGREPADAGSRLTVSPIGRPIVAGGQELDVRWEFESTLDATAEATIEWSRDGGENWAVAGTGTLSEKSFQWDVPCEDASVVLLRLRLSGANGDDGFAAELGESFAIDCTPPSVQVEGELGTLGGQSVIDLTAEDGSGSGLEGVTVWLRFDETAAWRSLDPANAQIEFQESARARLTLDLRSIPEATYFIYLQGVDGVGNHAAFPGPETPAMGTFALDRTAPDLEARPSPIPLIAGIESHIGLTADWEDIAPPVILEGRVGGSGWTEIARWTSLPAPDARYTWTVPAASGELALRVVAKDAVGNATTKTLPSAQIGSAIQLVGFDAATEIRGGSAQPVAWRVDPQVLGSAAELRIRVDFRAGVGAPWVPVCEDQEIASQCLWDVPADGGDEFSLRVRLLRGSATISEAIAGPIKVRAAASANEPAIAEESLTFFHAARNGVAEYHALRRELGTGEISPTDRDRLDELGQKARLNFQRAIELDGNNYYALYAYAQYLNRRGGEDPRLVERMLLRTLDIKKDHYWALNDLGAFYIRAERYAEAESMLERALKAKPSVEVHYNLALAQFYQSKMTLARANFEKALAGENAKRVPAGEVYYYVVHSHLQEGNAASARAVFNERESLIPEPERTELRQSLELD